MKTIEINAHLYLTTKPYTTKETSFRVDMWDGLEQCNDEWTVNSYLKPVKLTIEVDETTVPDPVAAILAALEAKKQKLRDEFNDKIFQINERIKNVQALPFEAPVSGVDGLPGHIPF
ncbi:conserved hypothetical protein [Cupriavidus necator]|uniref:Uncharacterized protein n=1 Tax=Cupriavidus necator TaxID=106590 RepID=A0A1K0IEG9_CUPNE|nr:conserved hypothetical protein [Cupriavidus necator]